MLKKLFYVLVVFSLVFIISPNSAKAYSPIIASCSNGVLDPNFAVHTNTDDVNQLFEVRLDHYYLDGVAIRAMSHFRPYDTTVSVIKRGGPTLASATVSVPSTESWVYVDLNNVAMSRGVYLLHVRSTIGNEVDWKYGPGSCIEDSHAIINDETELDKDMAFAIYAYDNSSTSSNPASGNTTNNNTINPDTTTDNSTNTDSSSEPSNTTTDEILPGNDTSNTNSSTSNTTEKPTTSQNPTDAELRAMLANDKTANTSGLEKLFLLFGSPIMGLLVSFFGFIFFILIIVLIIYLLTRKKRKGIDDKKDIAKKDGTKK